MAAAATQRARARKAPSSHQGCVETTHTARRRAPPPPAHRTPDRRQSSLGAYLQHRRRSGSSCPSPGSAHQRPHGRDRPPGPRAACPLSLARMYARVTSSACTRFVALLRSCGTVGRASAPWSRLRRCPAHRLRVDEAARGEQAPVLGRQDLERVRARGHLGRGRVRRNGARGRIGVEHACSFTRCDEKPSRGADVGGEAGTPANGAAAQGTAALHAVRAIELQGRSPEREREGGPASATYGSSAISRARLIATAICR
jgi:hypothetical protein